MELLDTSSEQYWLNMIMTKVCIVILSLYHTIITGYAGYY